MRKVYESPVIEFDDFELKDYICADLYGGMRGAEFYSVGNGNAAGASGYGDPITDKDTGGGEDLFD